MQTCMGEWELNEKSKPCTCSGSLVTVELPFESIKAAEFRNQYSKQLTSTIGFICFSKLFGEESLLTPDPNIQQVLFLGSLDSIHQTNLNVTPKYTCLSCVTFELSKVNLIAFCCDPIKSCSVSLIGNGKPQWKIQVLEEIGLVIQQMDFLFLNSEILPMHHIRQKNVLLDVIMLKLDFIRFKQLCCALLPARVQVKSQRPGSGLIMI